MNNARTILDLLDSKLDSEVTLTLYGRAALSLGYDDPPAEFGQSLDVDAILAIGQAEALMEQTNFWSAIDETNQALGGSGLYVSHLFVEDQVILTPGWQSSRVPLGGGWRHLDLYRLGEGDLLLSKLMRDDPHDRGDARFIAARAGFGEAEIRRLASEARMPESPEIAEQFAKALENLIGAL